MFLVFESKGRGHPAVDIDRSAITIGRIAANDVQIEDEKVSRHHAVIELHDGGRVVLRDLDSLNGTFVDGVRLSGARALTGGERLRFGNQQLRVQTGVPTPPLIRGAHDGLTPRMPPGASASAAPSRRFLPAGIGRRGAAAALLVVGAAAIIGIAQLLLPGVAEQKLRSDLGRYGLVRRVHLESSPAIKLLWHKADRVELAMDSYRSKPGGHGSLADSLSATRNTSVLNISVGTLTSKLVTLHDVSLHKEGDLLIGHARLTQQDLSAALPGFVGVRPLSGSANGIIARVTASALGHGLGARVAVLADSGRVVAHPEGIPLGSLAKITVFSDPRIYVESLGAELHGQDYLITVRARLR
jgi:hypothetical protein